MTAKNHGLKISREAARRFLIDRHMLSPARARTGGMEAVLDVVRRFGSVQFDPLSVAGRNHDLVFHARVADYQTEWTEALLYKERQLFETQNKGLSILPIEELPWYRVWWVQDPQYLEVLAVEAKLADIVLDRLRRDGPLSAIDFESGSTTNWFGTKMSLANAVLDALWNTGRIALSRRQGNRRYFDLVERIYPREILCIEIPYREQVKHKLRSRFQAHGLLGITSPAMVGIGRARPDPSQPDIPGRTELRDELIETGEIIPVRIEETPGIRFVMASEVDHLLSPPEPVDSVAFLAPLDPLIWDPAFLNRLWDFHYVWEVYLRPETRRWGYYVLPIQFRDRFVGKIEPRIDRNEARVRILSIHWETDFDLKTPGFVEAMREALRAYARFAGAATIEWPDHLKRERGLFSV